MWPVIQYSLYGVDNVKCDRRKRKLAFMAARRNRSHAILTHNFREAERQQKIMELNE